MNDYIRMIQERELVSFEEAQWFLKKANGNVEQAIFLIQKRKQSFWYRFSENTKNTIQSFWNYRIMICREDRIFLNISFSIFLLLVLLIACTGIQLTWWVIILVAFVIISGSELSLVKMSQTDGLVRKMEEKKTQRFPQDIGMGFEPKEDANISEKSAVESKKTIEPNSKNEQTIELNESMVGLEGYSEIIIK